MTKYPLPGQSIILCPLTAPGLRLWGQEWGDREWEVTGPLKVIMAVVDYRVSSPSLLLADEQCAAVCMLISCGRGEGERGPDCMAEALRRNLISQLLVQPRRLSLFHSIGGDRKGWRELSDMTGAVVMFYQLFVSMFTAKTETAGELWNRSPPECGDSEQALGRCKANAAHTKHLVYRFVEAWKVCRFVSTFPKIKGIHGWLGYTVYWYIWDT